jgi:PAS domain S-box-containing protein
MTPAEDGVPETGGSGSDAAGFDSRQEIETDAVAELGVDYAFRLEPDGTVAAVTGDVERLTGESESTVVGTSFERYIAHPDLEDAFEAFDAVLSGETVRGITLRFSRDEPLWVEVNAEPVTRDGEVVAVRGAVREATERRRALEQHSAAMRGAIDGMALLDDNGHYLFLNEAHAELYGYDRQELVGEHWSRLYDGTEHRRLAEEAMPAVRTVGSWRGEAEGRRRDGSTFRQDLSLAALDDGFVCVVRDVTDRHQRQQLIDVLDRVLRHNLRNDMNVVLGEAEAIGRAGDGDAARAAGRIRERARNLLEISDTARAVREVVASDGDPNATDLRAVARRECRLLDDADADVTIDAGGRPVPVACTGLRHAVAELVENVLEHACQAAEATEGTADGSVARVSVARTDDDGATMGLLRVADDGPGLPTMERLTLEEGRETPLRHGQGLGLWLVNWVVTRAGGELSVGERDGGGTVVEVRLPLADGAMAGQTP